MLCYLQVPGLLKDFVSWIKKKYRINRRQQPNPLDIDINQRQQNSSDNEYQFSLRRIVDEIRTNKFSSIRSLLSSTNGDCIDDDDDENALETVFFFAKTIYLGHEPIACDITHTL